MGVAHQIRTAGQVVMVLGVGETYHRTQIALVPPPMPRRNTNDGSQNCPANEGR
jgi:hypothetical protein